MDPSRRRIGQATLALLAGSPLWDRAVAEAQTRRTITDDTLRALLESQGGAGIFADPARFEELRAAIVRTATHVAAIRAFAVDDDVPPAVMFHRS